MGDVNLPTVSPWWTDQRMLDGKELTPKEKEISKEQLEVLEKTLDTLNQPVQKGDMTAARARFNALKQQFESFSPQMKEYMYGVLQTDMGRKDLSEIFRSTLSSSSRDTLLKILNPQHNTDHIKKETIKDARNKLVEKALEGFSFEQKLCRYMNLFVDTDKQTNCENPDDSDKAKSEKLLNPPPK